MENTSTHFSCDIDNLGYGAIEREISDYFDMGFPDNSSIPMEFSEGKTEECILVCDNYSGTFSITAYKLKSGKYHLSVSLKGKLNKSK